MRRNQTEMVLQLLSELFDNEDGSNFDIDPQEKANLMQIVSEIGRAEQLSQMYSSNPLSIEYNSAQLTLETATNRFTAYYQVLKDRRLDQRQDDSLTQFLNKAKSIINRS
ncbi:MAG: hypothetical protein H0X01_01805 [Nitrospira sp.]|nr:hypothetical protein [Nitrospira sp.]